MKKILLFVTFFCLLSLFVSAVDMDLKEYKKDSPINLQVACNDNGQKCSSSSACNISIEYPNSSMMVIEQEMSRITGTNHLYNYTLSDSSILGEYGVTGNCVDGANSNNFEFRFLINSSGEEENPYLYIGFFLMIIAVIFAYLYAGFNVDENKFGVKIVLFFSAFLMICGGLIGSILIQTSYLTLYEVVEVMLWGNVLLIGIMAFYYLYYILTSKTDELEDED